MSQPHATSEAVPNNLPRASTLRNLVFVATLFAGLVLAGEGRAVAQEVYRNLNGSALAWFVCGLLVIIGAFVLWGCYVQAKTWRDVFKTSSGKGELLAMIVVMVVAGAFGAALGSNLSWQLNWTSGVSVESKSSDWPNTQGLLGWMLAVCVVISAWTVFAQYRAGQKKAST